MDVPQATTKLSPEDYIKDRLIERIETCSTRGKRYRGFYSATSTLTIVFGALVPVLINFNENNGKLLATLLSLTVTILASMEKIFHFREHWRSYDLTKNTLRGELYLFQTRSGPYQDASDDDEAFHRLVNRVERVIQDERAATIQMRTTPQVARGTGSP